VFCFRIFPGDAICSNRLVPGIPFAQEELLVNDTNGEFDICVYTVILLGKRGTAYPAESPIISR
jgi:hypothetical protein